MNNRFDLEALTWDDLPRRVNLAKAVVKNILSYLKGDEKVLEFGCGTGLVGLNIAPFVKELIGIDISQKMVEKFNEKAKKFNLNAKSKTTTLSLKDATMNKKTEKIDTKYTIKIGEQDISGEIKGSINNPKVTIDSSKFIEHKILNGISKYIKNGSLEDFGIGEKEQKAIKDTFFELFK